MYVVDLRTGERIEAPDDYHPAYLLPGETIGPDHIETLREAGEDEGVLDHLQMVGSPASYQASPTSEVIYPEDERFPWSMIQRVMRPVEASENGEHRRGGIQDRTPITSPPNVYKNWWWPFCSYNPRTKHGEPRGVKWNAPVCCGYYGSNYVKGSGNIVYQWQCGRYSTLPGLGSGQYWICPGYLYYKVDKSTWSNAYTPPKGYPIYRCK